MKGLEGNKGYSGVALTLIDSLSTLAVIGDAVNFEKSVQNKEDFNLLFTNIRFQLHIVCQRPFGFSY